MKIYVADNMWHITIKKWDRTITHTHFLSSLYPNIMSVIQLLCIKKGESLEDQSTETTRRLKPNQGRVGEERDTGANH